MAPIRLVRIGDAVMRSPGAPAQPQSVSCDHRKVGFWVKIGKAQTEQIFSALLR
jgi:hypothetical protein